MKFLKIFICLKKNNILLGIFFFLFIKRLSDDQKNIWESINIDIQCFLFILVLFVQFNFNDGSYGKMKWRRKEFFKGNRKCIDEKQQLFQEVRECLKILIDFIKVIDNEICFIVFYYQDYRMKLICMKVFYKVLMIKKENENDFIVK